MSGDGRVRTHGLHLDGHVGDRVVKQLQRLRVKLAVGDAHLAVVSSMTLRQALQETHGADHVAGVPWTGFGQRAHAHLVQAEAKSAP